MDEAEIRSKVEQRKQRADALGIVPCTRTLYLDYLRHYPDWAQNSPQYLYPSISNLQFVTVKNGTVEVLSVQINGAEYLFNFETAPPFMPAVDFLGSEATGFFLDHAGHATLALRYDGKVVLEFTLSGRRTDSGGTAWLLTDSATATEAFVEGPWVNEIIECARGASTFYREKKSAEDRVRDESRRAADLDRLKEKFDL